MALTNIIAHKLKGYGVRTFSAKEMAFNILGLMHLLLFSITVEPIWADLNGGMDCLPDLTVITTHIQANLRKKAGLCRAINIDSAADFKVINGVETERLYRLWTFFLASTSASSFHLWNLSSPCLTCRAMWLN